MSEATRHQGEEGRVKITTVQADPEAEPPVDAVLTDFCVTEYDVTEMRKTQPSTTSCDWDEEDETTYEDEDEVSRRLDGTFTCFTVDEIDEQVVLKAKVIGPMVLVDYGTHGAYLPRAGIRSIKKNHGGGSLQSFNVAFYSKGKYYYGVEAPD